MPHGGRPFEEGNRAGAGRHPAGKGPLRRGFFKDMALRLLERHQFPAKDGEKALTWEGEEELLRIAVKVLKRADPNTVTLIRDMAHYIDGKPVEKVKVLDPQPIRLVLHDGRSPTPEDPE